MESTSASTDTGKTETAKADAGTQNRSTIEFPYTDLDAAIDVAKGVHNAGGTACETEQLAAQIKMEASGGAFRLRINGAETFGLVSYERGGRVVLTDLGRSAVDPAKERAARMNSFLAVPLYARVYEEFKGGQLPPPPAIERAIVAMGVGQKVAERARQVMIRSAKQAGFFELAADRLVKPSIKDEIAPSAPIDGGDTFGTSKGGTLGGGGNGGDGTGGKHPLIQGLLMTLPPPGADWPAQNRADWLTMAASIFKMIYGGGKDGEAAVTFKETANNS